MQELEARQLLATLTWTGDGLDDLFSNPANWSVTSGTSATGVPTAGDDAIIDSDPDSTKVQVNASVTVNSISSTDGVGEPFEIANGTLTLTSASTFQNSLTLTAGTITGGGVVTVNGPMTWNGGTITDTNAGSALAFNVNGGLTLGVSSRNLTGRTLQLNSNTTWAVGNLTLDSTAVINNAAARTMEISGDTAMSGGQFTNSGLVIRSTSFNTATISSTFTNAAAGTVEVRSGTLSFTGSVTNISGGTLAGGTWYVNATLKFPSATSITNNAASIVLDGPSSGILNATTNALNLSSNASTGSFKIDSGRNYTTASAFSNAGVVSVGDGSTFATGGSGVYSQTSGSTALLFSTSILDPAPAGAGGSASFSGGSLAGFGTVQADVNVTNTGSVNPGSSPGKIIINGNYSQTAPTVLGIEIAGLTAGTQFDQVSVSGTVMLGGALNVNLINNFLPVPGATFRILDKTSAGAISGTFAGLAEGATFSAGSSGFRISYVGGDGNNDVVLTAVPIASIDSAVLTEGNAGAAALNFTVRLSSPTSQTVTVTANTSNGTATAPGDYTALSGQVVTFNPGETAQTVTVQVNGETIAEIDESFLVTLSNPVNAAIATAPALLKSFNTNLSAVALALDPATGELYVNSSGAIHEYDQTGAEALPTIPTPGGASGDFDLDFLPESLNVGGTVVPAGALLAANDFSVPNDTLYAINKDTGAVLASVVMQSPNVSSTVGMAYHAGRNTVFVVNYSSDIITEVNPATGSAINSFPVRPAGSPAFDVNFGDVDVDEATGNLLVVGSSQSTVRELTPTGVFVRDIAVGSLGIGGMSGIAIDDAKREAWVVNTGGSIYRVSLPVSVAAGVITNDDIAQVSISPVNLALTEGDSGSKAFTFTVSISTTTETPITVQVTTASGTATTADSDYVGIPAFPPQVLTFNPGGLLAQDVSVSVIGDEKIENDETFLVNLSNVTGPASLVTASAMGTIQNDDLPSLAITNVSQTEGDSGTKTFAYTVTLSSAAAANVTVDVNTVDGSATLSDNDYSATSLTLTFTPGELTKTVNVTVNGDTKVESDERFFVRLSNPSANARLSKTPTSLGSFSTNFAGSETSIGFDPASGNLFIGSVSSGIHEVRPNGLEVLPSLAIPGFTTSDALDFDFLPESVNLGGTSVPAGSLLVINGRDFPNRAYALNKDDGTILASVGIGTVEAIGAAYDAGRNSIFALDYPSGVVFEINPVTGATLNSFPSNPSNAPPFSVSFGDLEVNPATGNLLIVGSPQQVIREMTPTGAFVRDMNVSPLSISSMSGIAIDDANQEAWIVTTGGTVFRLNLLADSGIGRIINDDTALVDITPPSITHNEGNSGTTAFTFNVTLSNPNAGVVTVQVDTQDGSATVAGNDYQAITAQTITFNPGDPLSKPVTVLVNGDNLNEPDETFAVHLSNATGTGVMLGASAATGTITNDDLLNFTISSSSLTEGNSGTQNMAFTVTLAADSTSPVTVRVDTADNTATLANNDYQQVSGQVLTFNPGGPRTQQVQVPIVGDLAVEPNESFFVNLSNPTGGGAIFIGQGVGTILNDDVFMPSISVNDASVVEGDLTADDRRLAFTVSLSQAIPQDVTVRVDTAELTAVAGQDYVPLSNLLVTIPANQTSATFEVQVLEDFNIEGNETFGVSLSSPSTNATLGDGSGIGTIINDDNRTLTVSDANVVEGNLTADDRRLTFTVTLSQAIPEAVTVRLDTSDASAAAGQDYVALSNLLVTIPANQTIANFDVEVLEDFTIEANETFNVTLSSPSANATIADGLGTGQIINDDNRTLSVDDVSVVEGNLVADDRRLTFTVSLSQAISQDVTVRVDTSDLSALAGQDYVALMSVPVTIPANQTSATFQVQILEDFAVEPDETLLVNLSSPSANATIGDGVGQGTIINDDFPTFSINDVTQAEGSAGNAPFNFTVTLSANPLSPTSVTVNTANGTATTADNDYTAVNGLVLTFNPNGPLTQTVGVIVTGDTTQEPDETFVVNLTNATSSAGISDNQGLGTIVNDDFSVPSFSINDFQVSEGNSGTTTANFTLMLSQNPPQPVSVTINTADGTATTGDFDYDAVSNLVRTFNPGDPLTQTVSVTVHGDAKFETDQTFFVNLSNATSGALIGDAQGLATILNDDNRPTISINDRSVPETNSSFFDVFFDVTLSNPSDETVTVQVNTADATAMTADNDYVAVVNRSLTFNPGVTLQQTPVRINGDSKFEADQTFFVNLSNAANASTITDNQGLGTIQNDDGKPTITILGASASEGDVLTFNLSLSNLSDEQVTVLASTADGTATTADSDYSAFLNQLVTFAPGTNSATVLVQSIEDTKFEADQTFTVVLGSAANAGGVSGSPATGTIQNDDSRPTISLVPIASANEGNSGFADRAVTVQLSNASDEMIPVEIVALNLTSVAPLDYTFAGPGSMTFSPGGPLSQTLMVRINGDTVFERDEQFRLMLQNSQNATIGMGQIDIGILNDDTAPTLTVTGGQIQEGNVAADDRKIVFTIALSAVSGVDVAGTLATNSGTAVEGTDFGSLDGMSFLIPAGSQQIIVEAPLVEDTDVESDETFSLIATVADTSSVSNNGGAAQGDGTILNDDASGPPALNPAAVKDDGDSVYRERGVWTSGTDGYLGDVRYAPAGLGTRTATWKLSVVPGTYEIFATWTADAIRATNAPYTIFDGATSKAVARANQQLVPNDGTFGGKPWVKLGEYAFTSNLIVIQLSDAADGVVAADGVMAVLTQGQGESTTPAAPLDPLDVNKDGQVSPIDALLVINAINSGVAGAVGPSGLGDLASMDVNADHYISPIDALEIINYLNAQSTATSVSTEASDALFTHLGEGESVASDFFSDIDISNSASNPTDSRKR